MSTHKSYLRSYILGYALSILFTAAAFGMMLEHMRTLHATPTHAALMAGFITLAIAQLLVQLFFFLHVGRGQNKHWNAVVLGFAFFIITVLVGGTLWITHNLRHHMVQETFQNGQIAPQYEND